MGYIASSAPAPAPILISPTYPPITNPPGKVQGVPEYLTHFINVFSIFMWIEESWDTQTLLETKYSSLNLKIQNDPKKWKVNMEY